MEKRKQSGLSRESLASIIGESRISDRTISRIEGGDKKVSGKRRHWVLHALGMYDIENTEPYFIDLDDYLAHRHIDAYRVQYPHTDLGMSDNIWRDLVIYLPLIPPMWLADTLQRIAEPEPSNDYYVAEQIRRLFQKIPDSPGKRYADSIIANFSTKARNIMNSRRGKKAEKHIKDMFREILDDKEGGDEYRKALNGLTIHLLLLEA